MGHEGTIFFLQIVSGKLSDVIFHGGTVGNGILLTLTVLSVVSWTIMIEKARFFKRSRKETERFLELFRVERSLHGLIDSAKAFTASPEAKLVSSVAAELEGGAIKTPSALDKLMEAESISIVATWETYVQFLATTATISPLLGLFGTVWGIMAAFLSMGAQGSASLFVVGPGIAVALITTIFGLGAAIPAVVGYNYVQRSIRGKEDELSSFACRFRNRIVEGSYSELRKNAAAPEREGDYLSPPSGVK
ncbi:MAG: MotA/TolQ/ExbB proton channel family protein [Candidatus Krumholzibacteria bacterium]|nr:MotA/TolQ/ExbB proton channel family protein [Candidatus Krumholzibacteria bacterium]